MKPEICKGCPAYLEPGPVPPELNPDPKAIVILEAPGDQEIKQGKPTVGPTGSLFWYEANKAGLHRDQAVIMNTAWCQTKSTAAFFYCWKYRGKPVFDTLPQDIPVIVAGSMAKDVVLSQWAMHGITVARGCTDGRYTAMVHPSFIYRTGRFGDSSKQNLKPTLSYDIGSALDKDPPPPMHVQSLMPGGDFLSSDLETNRTLNPRLGNIEQIGFGGADGKVWREHYTEDHRALYQGTMLDRPIVYHNAEFDVYWKEHKGYQVPNWDCTLLAAHLLHGDLPLSLEFVNSLYVHVPPWKHRASKMGTDGKYHATDLYVTAIAWDRMRLELKQSGLWSLYQDEVKPITRCCIDLKHKGIKVDTALMQKMQIAFSMQIEKIDGALNKLAPGTNWDSSQQRISVLYDLWNLPKKYNDKTQRLTSDAEALDELAEETQHPGVRLLAARQLYAKMISTYTDHEVDEHDMFHFDLSFTTSTGRARGFLLTLPKGRMRSLFIPDYPDWEIAYLDWDRVELWISAICSGDKKFQEVLTKYNFHAYVGEMCFGHPIKKGTPEYESVKHITHGANYGRGIPSIAAGHNIPVAVVTRVLNWMENTFVDWAKWRRNRLETAQLTGGITNAFGYRRYMWSGNLKGMAFSFEPQSVVAHMIKRVTIQMCRELPKPARVLFPFHDAEAICYPTEMRQQVIPVAKQIMERSWDELGGWSAKCSVGIGNNLQEAAEDEIIGASF